MNKGCLIFAHNSPEVDYGSQAVLSALLISKTLKVPVSLVTDQGTIDYAKTKFDSFPFDQIIIVDAPVRTNYRRLYNGAENQKNISFINSNRNDAWELTPYDRTLVVDADFLVFSDHLNKYWDCEESFLISPGMIDPLIVDLDPKDHWVSRNSIRMLWATNFMFTKNQETKLFFDLMHHIQENYAYYGATYDFDASRYRNDYVFSIACHIMSNFGQARWHGELPSPLLIRDIDELIKIDDKGILFLLHDYTRQLHPTLFRTARQDLHLMNKWALLSNMEQLLEIAYE
jgi:hypothetical protein